MFDVITLGETLYRLTPPGHQRIAQATQLDMFVAGSESNTSVGLARLGLRVAWLSRLTDNALGRAVAATLRSQGVNVDSVIWTDQDRMALYFLEEGAPPRDSRVIYDRAHSAMSRMQPADLPADLFQPGRACLFHTSGITLALSDSARQTAQRAWELAQAAGWQLSFDLNYRRLLWSAEAARAACEPFLQAARVIFTPQRDAEQVLGLSGTADEIIDQLHARYPQARIVMTRGGAGASACDESGRVARLPALNAPQPVGRVGGGDAFSAGFLYGHLTDDDMERALRWGVVVAGLKYTIPGDLPLIDREEAARLVDAASGGYGLIR